MNYVFQLETMGHWEWAAYVLLCIYSPVNNQNVKPRHDSKFDSVRVVENALRELLARHAPDFVEQSEKRKFLSEVCFELYI